jgi:predicted nucleic acid-binding protein
VLALYRSYGVVVWWTTAVEMASALRRLVRMKQLTPDDWAKSCRLALELAGSWRVIQPSNSLRAGAVQLVDRYDLRAADALQLAAALQWCENVPQGRVFMASDQRLREAAVLRGFDGKVI